MHGHVHPYNYYKYTLVHSDVLEIYPCILLLCFTLSTGKASKKTHTGSVGPRARMELTGTWQSQGASVQPTIRQDLIPDAARLELSAANDVMTCKPISLSSTGLRPTNDSLRLCIARLVLENLPQNDAYNRRNAPLTTCRTLLAARRHCWEAAWRLEEHAGKLADCLLAVWLTAGLPV